MSDLTNKIAAYWREEITRAHALARQPVEQDAADRGLSSSSSAAGAVKALEQDMERLMNFVQLAEEAAGDNALALAQTPPPIPLGWRLTPHIIPAASAVARAMQG